MNEGRGIALVRAFAQRNHQLVPWWAIPLGLRVAWNVVFALLTLLAGVATLLDRELAKHTWPWIHRDFVQIILGSGILLVIFLENSRRAWRRHREGPTESLRVQIDRQLGAAIATTGEVAGLHASELGAGVFLKQIHPLRPWLRLKRAARVRLLNDITDSGITFTPGTGVVGRCWRTRNPEHHDWTAINRTYAGNLPDEKKWASLPEKTRRGFDYDGWCRMVGRYSEVLAVPIAFENRYIGVLALDWAWDPEDPRAGRHLDKREIKKPLALVADALGTLLK